MKILFTCGGTAGHINPAVALARLFQERSGAEVLFVGAKGGMEERLVPKEGFALETVTISSFWRSVSPASIKHNLTTVRNLCVSRKEANRILDDFQPDLVVGTGGYASYPVAHEAAKRGSDLVLIDTAGRLHTSPDLMRELAKVVNVTRKRAANMAAGPMPVYVVLVIDAATGQNGLNQALEFNEALGLDGIIMTKLDGTAKGGIAMAVAEKLKLPILRIGVGEQVDDLQEFNAKDFCRALVGESN